MSSKPLPSTARVAAAAAAHGATPYEPDPLDSEPPRSTLHIARESTITMRNVRALIEAAEQVGVPRAAFLSAAGLDAAQVEVEETRVPRFQVYRLCELAMDLSKDPAFGLHWAERMTESTFLPVSNLMAHSRSLRQALQTVEHYFRLLSDESRLQVVELEHEVIVRCRPIARESVRIVRFTAEMITLGLLKQIRRICVHAPVERVSFEYPAPAYHAEYSRLFENAERFEQPFTGLVFDRALMDVPSPYNDGDLHEAVRAMAERRLQRIEHRTAYWLRVRDYLISEGWPHRTDMRSAARGLGMSSRSLRRRLVAEGKPYAEIMHEALAIVAKQLLSDESRSVDDVACAMGFGDKSAFYRAFKRWTGMTPSAYRSRELAGS